ncbi:hypothetical protein SALINJAH_256 [Bacillus phage SalinJah]|uniref:Uncharacterized protein n=1 Tax=Bacillus phage SalinJah TaxID=1837830 RepID=A0A173GBW3_9CAUD|nr:hypothetical protein SALINJAH_256 [Bacillus phage SalinJah]ANH50812.1 hypothetical protein SALINJAH_256 [Bacillus phage SalinJah]
MKKLEMVVKMQECVKEVESICVYDAGKLALLTNQYMGIRLHYTCLKADRVYKAICCGDMDYLQNIHRRALEIIMGYMIDTTYDIKVGA